MKKYFHSVAVMATASLLLFAASCKEETVHGEGAITTEQKSVSDFDKIIIDLPGNANIYVGETAEVDVKTHHNLHEYIKTEVTAGTLRVYRKSGILNFDFSNIDINIHLPRLAKLQINGAADAKIHGDLNGDDFELHVRGASDVEIEKMHIDKLDVVLSGASELDINSGTVNSANYKVTGAGEVNAEKLVTAEAKARVSGAGDMRLHVTNKLDARISGAGEIGYTGHPELTSKVTGIGSITDRN
ncbi:MAG: DUF2807 domain-containing protein [Chitinophagaceae bacterium]|nr:DUF2807 domain-containing protein [Chitinophagaceae bacterium]